MPISDSQATAARQHLEEAETQLNRLNEAAHGVREAKQAVAQALSALSGAGSPSGGTSSGDADDVDFGDFFADVGQSVISAQKQLDTNSGKYLQQTAGTAHILPSVFRIPKLTAEVKFAFGKVKEKKINVLFYGKKEEAETMHQQSVSFEIAAAPPPPELASLLQRARPRLELIIEPTDRKEILDLLAAAGVPLPQALKSNPNRTLIASLAELSDVRLIAFANKQAGSRGIGIWSVNVKSKDAGVLYQFSGDPRAGDDMRPLKAFMIKVADQQEAALKLLSPLETE